jgi:uncharacterized repeat protein (TIGR01451 family)
MKKKYFIVLVVVLALLTISFISYEALTETWSFTGSMSTPRLAKGVILCDGNVLVPGGEGPQMNQVLSSTELYDWNTGTWTTVASMNIARMFHAVVRLKDVRVLVVGGCSGRGGPGYPPNITYSSAEIYDPATNTWTLTGPMSVPRSGIANSTVLLNDGRVLVVGGHDGTQYLTSAEIYDPNTGTWSSAGNTCDAYGLNCARKNLAFKLNDGRVLVAGGPAAPPQGRYCYLYDPSSNTWCRTADLPEGGAGEGGLIPTTGQVVVLIGCNEGGWCEDPDTYIYTPAPGCSGGLWSYAGSLYPDHGNATFVCLPDGRLLCIGGSLWPAGSRTTVHIYQNGWTQGPSLNVSRQNATAIGFGMKVLVAGGIHTSEWQPYSGVPINTAERIEFLCPPGVDCSPLDPCEAIEADLSVTKADSPDPVLTGNNLTYTVNIANNGPSGATGVIVKDTLPSGVTFVSATSSQGSCSYANGIVTCNLETLNSGKSATVTIVVRPTVGGTITNTASVSSNEFDPNMANNTATESTTVIIKAAIDIKPGSYPNSINPKSKGNIPVAILSSATFDAPSQVEKTSLTFGRTGDEQSLAFCNPNGEDVNGDGLLDLICHFETQKTGFQSGDTQGVLKGKTVDGTPIKGTDSVKIVSQ